MPNCSICFPNPQSQLKSALLLEESETNNQQFLLQESGDKILL